MHACVIQGFNEVVAILSIIASTCAALLNGIIVVGDGILTMRRVIKSLVCIGAVACMWAVPPWLKFVLLVAALT